MSTNHSPLFLPEDSLTTKARKSFVINAASSAGVMAGIYAVATGIGFLVKRSNENDDTTPTEQ